MSWIKNTIKPVTLEKVTPFVRKLVRDLVTNTETWSAADNKGEVIFTNKSNGATFKQIFAPYSQPYVDGFAKADQQLMMVAIKLYRQRVATYKEKAKVALTSKMFNIHYGE